MRRAHAGDRLLREVVSLRSECDPGLLGDE